MGRDIDENATLPSVPQWTRVEWAAESAGTQTTYKIVNGKRNHGRRDSGSDSSEDYLGPANKTFLDTETLCSRTGSLAHLHLRPRPFHHYQDPSTPATCSQPHAQRAHAYAQAFASTHSRQQSQSQSQSQAQAQHQPPLQSPVESDTSDDTEPSERSPDLVYRSFLSSPHTSLAAMPSPQLSAGNGLDMHTVSTSLTNWPWRQEQKIELRLPKDSKADDRPQTGPQRSHQDLEDADSNSFSNNLLSASAERRPSSSRSHLRWRRNRSLDRDASNYLRVSSDDQASSIDVRPSMIITRDEFEALPPTIKRKYFTTIERSRFARYPDLDNFFRLASPDKKQPKLFGLGTSTSPKSPGFESTYINSDISTDTSRSRPRISSLDQRFYANLPDKIKRRHLTEEEFLFAQSRRRSDSTKSSTDTPTQSSRSLQDRALQDHIMQSPLPSPTLFEGHPSRSSFQPRQNDKTDLHKEHKRTDSFYDSFRWLEDDEGLDLRLYLDDYHINLREDVPVPSKNRRPSFRRHLSINKLPFGRASVSYGRPDARDGMASPTLISPSLSQSSMLSSTGHVRRRSRALSLISSNKQMLPDLSAPFDPAAAHYQDPEARMKLRKCLASPKNFDETIEFGFPSRDGVQPHDTKHVKKLERNPQATNETDKLRSFLEDDRSSSCSDDVSLADMDSPKTPQLFEKTTMVRPTGLSTERPACTKEEDAIRQSSLSREMTLRMTLTRPDLRQSEDKIYGWKQSGSNRGANERDDPLANVAIYARDGVSKESIERQLAALDHWGGHTVPDNGVVKRMWNRVRRS